MQLENVHVAEQPTAKDFCIDVNEKSVNKATKLI